MRTATKPPGNAPRWLRRLAVVEGALTVTPPVALSLLMLVIALFPVLMLTIPVLLLRGLASPLRARPPGRKYAGTPARVGLA